MPYLPLLQPYLDLPMFNPLQFPPQIPVTLTPQRLKERDYLELLLLWVQMSRIIDQCHIMFQDKVNKVLWRTLSDLPLGISLPLLLDQRPRPRCHDQEVSIQTPQRPCKDLEIVEYNEFYKSNG